MFRQLCLDGTKTPHLVMRKFMTVNNYILIGSPIALKNIKVQPDSSNI